MTTATARQEGAEQLVYTLGDKLYLNVTNREVCVGMLYFPIAGGVQPGDWRLVLEFEETDAVVPFTLGEG